MVRLARARQLPSRVSVMKHALITEWASASWLARRVCAADSRRSVDPGAGENRDIGSSPMKWMASAAPVSSMKLPAVKIEYEASRERWRSRVAAEVRDR